MDKVHRDAVVAVRWFGDRIMSITLAIEPEIVHIISIYAPQVGLDNETKKEFWDFLGDVFSRISREKKIFLSRDLNGHVGKDRNWVERVHEGQDFGVQNNTGSSVLDFDLASESVTLG